MNEIKDKEIEELIEKKKLESDALKKILKSIDTQNQLLKKQNIKSNK